ncbi:MAG: protein translocase SEC61 complex subunit gamma [Nanoarchaeota archaeon]|nr:protein translocase SEC61 complex subunit gamma [Nanoarchaeota archaeon]
MWDQFKEFTAKCGRVLVVMRKPTKQEFKLVAQAAALGMLLMGAIGFFISMVVKLVF